MKTLNENAVKILTALIEKGRQTIDENKEIHAKVVQDLGRYRVINLTLYQTEDDTRMREPEITILHETFRDEYVPSNICNDFAHIASNSATLYNGQINVWNTKIQADHTDITNDLLQKIEELL